MSYGLTPEEISRRKKNREERHQGTIGHGGHFVPAWRGKDYQDHLLDFILHCGRPIEEMRRHVYKAPVELKASDKHPARTTLVTKYYRCAQPEKFWIGLYREGIKKISDYRGPLTCPFCKLVRHLAWNHSKEAVFAFGRGCTTSDGTPFAVTEVTGEDAAGLVQSGTSYQRDMTGRSMRGMLVVPIRIGSDKFLGEAEVKISVESFSLGKQFAEEIESSIKRFGEDEADPALAPAAYRFEYDEKQVGAAKYDVQFLSELVGKVEPRFIDAWRNDPPKEVLETFDKELCSPGDPYVAIKDLEKSLRINLDLYEVMGVQASAKPAQQTHTTAPQKAASHAPQVQSKGRRAAAVEAAPEPEASDDVDAEPCEMCGTPWPVGTPRCPGFGKTPRKNDPSKMCVMEEVDDGTTGKIPF